MPVGPEQRLLAASVADFLRLDPSFDLHASVGNPGVNEQSGAVFGAARFS